MAKREPIQASPKLLSLLRDFQSIASMAGYLTHVMDAPQLRLMFTLYARIMAPSEEVAAAQSSLLQTWCDRIGTDLREGSSSAVLPPQVLIANPQVQPNGQWLLVATVSFNSKVTDSSYLRVRTAVLKAFQRAVVLREKGLEEAMQLLDTPESWEIVATSEIPLLAVPSSDPDATIAGDEIGPPSIVPEALASFGETQSPTAPSAAQPPEPLLRDSI